MNINDLITVGILFVLFGVAMSVIGYFVGKAHGFEAGYESGCVDEITRLKPRVIQAMRRASIIARTLCMAQMNRTTNNRSRGTAQLGTRKLTQ